MQNIWAHGVYFSGKPDGLEPVIQKWAELYENLDGAFPQSADSNYLEISLVGLLATAAWMEDIPANAEWPLIKGDQTRRGRGDLLLKLSGRPTAIEAKIDWYGNLDKFDHILGNLRNAHQNATSIPEQVVENRYGVCFAVLEKQDPSSEELLDHAKAQMQEEWKLSEYFLAWAIKSTKKRCVPKINTQDVFWLA
ncbi:MAG: hypothetical protein EXR36_07565 [Betaproteobacteria bacterium]|nr:hypothetical protein [Betaproteobacteria bacterium]